MGQPLHLALFLLPIFGFITNAFRSMQVIKQQITRLKQNKIRGALQLI